MRGRIRVFSVIAMLTAVMIVSAVFASGVVNPSTFTLNTMTTVQPDSPANDVFVDPDTIIKDYLNDPGYQIGDTFTLSINVSSMTDLYTYQLNVTWDPAILNFTKRVTYGDFLARTASPDGTSRIVPIAGGDNVTGYGWTAETILGNYPGITGSGRLVTLEFQVVGYGATKITVSLAGTLPTSLLDSTGASITITVLTVTRPDGTYDGYFKNKLFGDSNGDGTVNVLDMGTLSGRWTGAPGALPYSRDVDCNDDGSINVLDMGVVSANWNRGPV